MKNRVLRTELLESRTYLAVTVGFDGANDLLITGETDQPIEIRSTGSNAFALTADGETHHLQGAEGKDVRRVILHDAQTATVTINLNSATKEVVFEGNTAAGAVAFHGGSGGYNLTVADGASVDGLMADLGNGINTIQVNGKIFRSLLVRGGNDKDSVTVGANAEVRGNLMAFLGEGDNQVVVEGQVSGSLVQRGGHGIDTLKVSEGIDQEARAGSVGRTVTTVLGNGNNSVTLDGEVGRSVTVRGGLNDDTIAVGGNVGGSIVAWLATGKADVNVAGDVAGGLAVQAANYFDDAQGTLSIAGSVGRSVNAFFGSGPNTIHLADQATITGSLFLTTGSGNDTVTLHGNVTQAVFAMLGSGDNSLTLSGGVGTDFSYLGLGGNDEVQIVDEAQIIGPKPIVGGGVQVYLGKGTNKLVQSKEIGANLFIFGTANAEDVRYDRSKVHGTAFDVTSSPDESE